MPSPRNVLVPGFVFAIEITLIVRNLRKRLRPRT
jgi:hypothetical protein